MSARDDDFDRLMALHELALSVEHLDGLHDEAVDECWRCDLAGAQAALDALGEAVDRLAG